MILEVFSSFDDSMSLIWVTLLWVYTTGLLIRRKKLIRPSTNGSSLVVPDTGSYGGLQPS